MSASKRFKSLEEAFDLPGIDDNDDDINQDSEVPSLEEVSEALEHANDLEKQFSKISGFDRHDEEMDELASLAIQAHKDLQDLGMNVEIRHAGEIFSSSSAMLKIAVDAKNLKVEKKLKLLKLQLDKMKIDLTFKGDDRTVEGQAVKLDRNELLKQLKQINEIDK